MSPQRNRRRSPSGEGGEALEVDLDLPARRRVVDSHRRPPTTRAASFGGQAGQGALGDFDPPSVQEDPDHDDGQVLVDPRLVLVLRLDQPHPCGEMVKRPRSTEVDAPLSLVRSLGQTRWQPSGKSSLRTGAQHRTNVVAE